uniref:Uncharacterized protein n=1 Tax=Oryza nivara TaxID=4536 RepID=A0A0E0HC13_ORYNI
MSEETLGLATNAWYPKQYSWPLVSRENVYPYPSKKQFRNRADNGERATDSGGWGRRDDSHWEEEGNFFQERGGGEDFHFRFHPGLGFNREGGGRGWMSQGFRPRGARSFGTIRGGFAGRPGRSGAHHAGRSNLPSYGQRAMDNGTGRAEKTTTVSGSNKGGTLVLGGKKEAWQNKAGDLGASVAGKEGRGKNVVGEVVSEGDAKDQEFDRPVEEEEEELKKMADQIIDVVMEDMLGEIYDRVAREGEEQDLGNRQGQEMGDGLQEKVVLMANVEEVIVTPEGELDRMGRLEENFLGDHPFTDEEECSVSGDEQEVCDNHILDHLCGKVMEEVMDEADMHLSCDSDYIHINHHKGCKKSGNKLRRKGRGFKVGNKKGSL